jgi:hypothetical protein
MESNGILRGDLFDAADTIEALAHDLIDAADTVNALIAAPKVEMAVEGPFNKATVYRNCAVQVCENTQTGASSVAWTQNPEIIEKWEAEQYETEGAEE